MKVQTGLIEVDDLIKLVNLTILTGRVRDGKRISMLLVGDTETGKTQILEVFMNLKPVIWANDLSAKIIVMDVAPQVEKGKTHILIPDFLKILGHQKVVARNTITMLNAITEEGLKNVMFYGSQKEFKQPVKCGVIAAITKSGYMAREQYWKGIGFVGRCIPVSFSYSDETKMKIHEHIRTGFPSKTIDVITGMSANVEIPQAIGERVQGLVLDSAPCSTGFRLHKQMRALVQAHALYRGRSIVTEEDFEEIRRLSKYMNLDFNAV